MASDLDLRIGFIPVSKKLIDSKEWKVIQKAIKEKFVEAQRVDLGTQVVLWGVSSMFELYEGEKKGYLPIIQDNEVKSFVRIAG